MNKNNNDQHTKFDGFLAKKEQILRRKHKKRLDEMTALAISQASSEFDLADVEQYLNEKTQALGEKYQETLQEMTARAVTQESTQVFSEQLDQKAKELAFKHQKRLHEMTALAVNQQSAYTFPSLIASFLKPAPMMALASVLSVAVALSIFLGKQDVQKSSGIVQARADMPAWVKDTDVPLDILENMDFYVWLSQQNQFAENTNKITLAAAWHNHLSVSKRYSPRNIAEGFFRKTSAIGEL